MEKRTLRIGEVVQIDPGFDDKFAACFMTVTDPKSFGAQGFVRVPGGGDAYCRVNFEDIEPIGFAVWQPANDEQD